jgi:glycosyltransferase involved in cell wall biosynthesis
LELAALTFSRRLAALGHTISAFFRRDGDLLPVYRGFCRDVFVLNTLRVAGPFAEELLAVRRSKTPKVVYGHQAQRIFQLWLLSVITGSPCVCHLHLPPQKMNRMNLFGLRHTDLFIAVSRATADGWASELGIPTEKIEVIRNGVDTERFAPADNAEKKKEWGIDADCKVISFLGRLDQQKGIDVLIRAFALYVARTPTTNVCLLIAGAPVQQGNEYVESLRKLAEELVPGKVRFVGHMADSRRVYQASDLFVISSVWPDPCPLTISESMACGVPVLASRIGGIPEVLGEAFATHLFEPGNAHALAEKIGEFIDWRTSTPGLGNWCREKMEKEFAMGACVAKIEEALVRVAMGSSASFA